MKRRAFNLMAGLSLLLSIGTLMAWYGGSTHGNIEGIFVNWDHTGALSQDMALTSYRGDLRLYWVTVWLAKPETRTPVMWYFGSRSTNLNGQGHHFRFEVIQSADQAGAYKFRDIDAPIWPLTIFFGIFPAVRLSIAIHRRRKFKPGFCRTCGYDLRATPDRCPECGMVPQLTAVARQ